MDVYQIPNFVTPSWNGVTKLGIWGFILPRQVCYCSFKYSKQAVYRSFNAIERTSDPGPKHTEGKKPSPGFLPGYLWGPVVLLTASGAEPPASSAFPWCDGV